MQRHRILAVQIPLFWETIKFAEKYVNQIPKEIEQAHFNELLHALLNDKAQCFVRTDDERKLIGIMITRFVMDKITGEKQLLLQTLYSLHPVSHQEWVESHTFVRDFARQTNCKSLVLETANPAVWNLVELLGFRESTRKFTMGV